MKVDGKDSELIPYPSSLNLCLASETFLNSLESEFFNTLSYL